MAGEDTAVRDLNYYYANPEELDNETLTALLESDGEGQAASGDGNGNEADEAANEGKQDEPKAGDKQGDNGEGNGSGDAGEAASAGGEPPASNEGKQDEPEPIVRAADGKSEIPYSVVRGLRGRIREGEETLAQERAEKERLQAQLEALQQGNAGDGDQNAGTPDISKNGLPRDAEGNVDYERLREDFPSEIVDAMEASDRRSNARTEQLAAEVAQLKAQQEKAQHAQEATQQDEIQTAIDSVPALTKWQHADPESEEGKLWRRAVALDSAFQQDPDFLDKTYAERFREVVKTLGYDPESGQTSAPGNTNTGDRNSGRKTSVEDAERAAAARDSGPATLSELPGGEPAAQSGIESLENVSTVQLAETLSNMTPEQQQAWLAARGV